MTTSTAQKINLNNCTHEELCKALARIEARIATTSVRDKDREAHPIKHIAAMAEAAEHYVPSEADNVSTTRLGNPQFRDWLPRDFEANKIYWEKKGVTGGKVTHQYLPKSSYGTARGVFQTMSGTQVNILSPNFQTNFQNFICYPPSPI
jgi:hypothetical protein